MKPITTSTDARDVVSGVFTTARAPERLTFTFRREADVFTQCAFRDETSRDHHRAGWSDSHDNLALFLHP